MTLLGVEEIRAACGITVPVLPPGFLPDLHYDKWGNRILDNGQRLPGSMLGDDGARKILARAGLLYTVFASVEA